MRLVKNNQNIPVPDPDSIPDSSSPDSSFRENDIAINSEINQMRLVKNKQIIPAPEPDSNPDSSSPDSSSPEAGSTPDESSPEADSIADKVGKIK